jgi:hypothetical protein
MSAMGLFGDTLRDARRPLAGGSATLRRSSAPGAAESLSLDELMEPAPAADSGLQTVFRFQKADPVAQAPGIREASYQTRGGMNRPSTGDPWSAEAPVERNGPSAKAVFSVQADSQESNLEAGTTANANRSEAASFRAEPEVSGSRSSLMSGPLASVPFALSEAPQFLDMQTMLSQRDETVLSRGAGRGAPSESFVPATGDGQSPARLPQDTPPAAVHSQAVPRALLQARSAAAWSELQARHPAAQGFTRTEPWMANPTPRTEPPRTAFAPPAASPAAAPVLRIGRIDVTVQASAPAPATPHQPSALGTAFLSRNYLRRL